MLALNTGVSVTQDAGCVGLASGAACAWPSVRLFADLARSWKTTCPAGVPPRTRGVTSPVCTGNILSSDQGPKQ